jgi:hypothetical protein
MKRHATFALILGTAIVLGTTAAAQVSGGTGGIAVSTWARANIHADGWLMGGPSSDESFYWYYKPGPPSETGGHSLMWVRFEYPTPQHYEGVEFSSLSGLQDFDCALQRLKPLQETLYKHNGLVGPVMEVPPPSSWTYAVPGSTGEQMVRDACAR